MEGRILAKQYGYSWQTSCKDPIIFSVVLLCQQLQVFPLTVQMWLTIYFDRIWWWDVISKWAANWITRFIRVFSHLSSGLAQQKYAPVHLHQWIILVLVYCQLGDYILIYYLPPFTRSWNIHWLELPGSHLPVFFAIFHLVWWILSMNLSVRDHFGPLVIQAVCRGWNPTHLYTIKALFHKDHKAIVTHDAPIRISFSWCMSCQVFCFHFSTAPRLWRNGIGPISCRDNCG